MGEWCEERPGQSGSGQVVSRMRRKEKKGGKSGKGDGKND